MLASAEIGLGFLFIFLLCAGAAVVGLVVLVVKGVFKAIGGFFRICFGGWCTAKRPSGRARDTAADYCGKSHGVQGGVRYCTNPKCGHGNPLVAAYCARCGQRIERGNS